jgi:AraC-like DNA-binding protein
VSEVFHAWFREHAYPMHAHGTWTLFIVDDGVITYDLDRHQHGSTRPTVTLLPPHVVHDGRAATSRGFRKRVIYLDADLLGERLIGPAVDHPVVFDRLLRDSVSATHRLLESRDDALAAETRLAFIVERLRAHLHAAGEPPDAQHTGLAGLTASTADHLRALLDERLTETVTLATAGRVIGANPAHLVRTFTRTFGISPHAYVLGRRIELARQRLLDGEPPADVAVAVGFHDQSHFTRHFKRHVGTTPGRYARRTT